jgi:hypothetical protein
MKIIFSLVFMAIGATLTAPAFAQKGPQIKDMKPGRYAYNIEMHNPGFPMKMPGMQFTQCVTAKDMDDGKAFQAQKDAGVDCAYSNVSSNPGRFQFSAVCKVPGGMSMEADYTGIVSGDLVTMDIKQKMTGGNMPDNMRHSTMKMVMNRQGDC